MPRSVDKIQDIVFPLKGVFHLNGVAFNGNAPLPLQVHIIQQLILFFALCYRTGLIEQTVGQGTLPVIDMRNDAEIPNVFHSRK